jgi:hypothetical protein
MKMRPKVSIDSIDRYYRYRSIDPSPIVPIYAYYHVILDTLNDNDVHCGVDDCYIPGDQGGLDVWMMALKNVISVM